MDAIFILLPISLAVAGIFLAIFLRAVSTGQFEDLDDAAVRAIKED